MLNPRIEFNEWFSTQESMQIMDSGCCQEVYIGPIIFTPHPLRHQVNKLNTWFGIIIIIVLVALLLY